MRNSSKVWCCFPPYGYYTWLLPCDYNGDYETQQQIKGHDMCSMCDTFQCSEITKTRSSAMENIENQTQNNVSVITMVIKEKATSLFKELKCSEGESSTLETFCASDGWFSRFKRHHSLCSLKVALVLLLIIYYYYYYYYCKF